MDYQRKIRKDIGQDTFARSVDVDAFSKNSTRSFEVLPGEIMLPQPEPFFRQTAVTVKLTKGGMITGVAYPNAFLDPITGNLHGSYEGPIPGQMVQVGFVNGNSNAPYVVNRYPYQGVGNSLTSLAYQLPMTKKLYDATDVLIGHFSGSVLRFNTGLLSGKLPGSVTLDAVTQLELNGLMVAISGGASVNITSDIGPVDISANTQISVSSPATAIEGLVTLELTGGTSVKIASETQTMATLIQSLFTVLESLVTVGSATTQTISPATIALLQAEALKWNALLIP